MAKNTDKLKSGNGCLFILYNLMNLLFFLQSLLVIGMGIWLWYEVEKIGPFNIGLTVLGLFEFALSLGGQHVRKSKGRMNCYMFFMSILFVAQALLTSIGIASKSQIIDWAADRNNSPQEAEQIKSLIQKNVSTALYITIAAVVIQFLCIWSVCAYRRSFIERNESHDFLIQTDEGKVNLYEKQAKDKAAIQEKYDKLRKEHDEKFKDYRSSSRQSDSYNIQDDKKKKKNKK